MGSFAAPARTRQHQHRPARLARSPRTRLPQEVMHMQDNSAARKKLNQEVKLCRRCGLTETAAHHLAGEGDPTARLFFIAQAPGEEEDREGRMFIGPSGTIFRKLLQHAGLEWDDIYVTNLLKCRLPMNRRPKLAEIEACSYLLKQEIAFGHAEILIPLGFYAARYLFGEYLQNELEKHAYASIIGKVFPITSTPGNWQPGTSGFSEDLVPDHSQPLSLLPLPHPASLLHKPELADSITRNFSKLSVVKEPCKWQRVCPIDWFTKRGELPDCWVKTYCFGDWSSA